jgi:hypothetical protein
VLSGDFYTIWRTDQHVRGKEKIYASYLADDHSEVLEDLLLLVEAEFGIPM